VSRFHSYLNTARDILSLYEGKEPFPSFSKKYFAQFKKYGSTDRKWISHLCYCFFRLGKALISLPIEEKIITALFLCCESPDSMLETLKPEWNQRTTGSVSEKISFLKLPAINDTLFPFGKELSTHINQEEFSLSFLRQPDLFLRIRPGKEMVVKKKLQSAGIEFQSVSENCLALNNASKIADAVILDKEAVVQDYSSQKVGQFFLTVKESMKNEIPRVWDCCAASGGKSIMAKDMLGEMDLIVSDIRESILINLENRFETAGITDYERFAADLSKPLNVFLSTFNLIIADVPCTGSGTWGRTPEQLFYFDSNKIEEYVLLQRKIIATILSQLEPGGYLLYITCSVFKKENEEAVEYLKEKFHLQLVKMELIHGYRLKADTMFAALLQKPL
jgi:16S rRNA (cytosine967-C5)-methyltransferase